MKQPKIFESARRSIFVKLVLIFVLTGVLTVGLVLGMATHFSHVHDHVWENRNKNRVEYVNLLVDQIGTPPDLKKADEIVARTGVRMRIEGKGISYSTPLAKHSISELEAKAHRCVWQSGTKIMAYEGRIYLAINRIGVDYLISYENDSFLDERPEWWPILAALVLFALFANYLAIQWLFKPIRWLSEGVKKVQDGNLQFQVRTRDHDELGDLTKSFNRMTQEIEGMLKSKEQLLLDVSHELRSPLTRIKVALELNDEGCQEQIKKNIRDLEVMISELLESARLDTPQGKLVLTDTNLSSLIDRVGSKLKGDQPGLRILPIPPKLSIPIDGPRVETVLKNLLENALKYSHHQTHPTEISVLTPEAEQVWIQVRDYGHGIPEDERSLIFEPFYRIDKSRVRETGGYGLGLALCKKIMLAHEGAIEVSSSDASGTVFTLKFKTNEGRV